MKVRTKHNVLERPFCLDRARGGRQRSQQLVLEK
jgi:hypothetical protein